MMKNDDPSSGKFIQRTCISLVDVDDVEVDDEAVIVPAKKSSMTQSYTVDESVSEEKSTSYGQDNGQITEPESPEQISISKQESADVNRFKIVVILVLLIVAITVSTCVFLFISKAEQSRFEQKFNSDAIKVLEAVRVSIDNTLTPMDALAVAFVSYARDKNQTWPFVTIPNFGLRIGKVLPLTDAFMIQTLPMITPANRLQWENYSRTHDSWVDDTIIIQEKWENYFGPKNISYDIELAAQVNGDFGPIEDNVSRLMFPQWQVFPCIPSGGAVYNYDWNSVTMPEALLAGYSGYHSILSDPYLVPEPDDPAILVEAEVFIAFFNNFIGPNENPYEPVMDIFYPIMNDVSSIKLDGAADNHTARNEIVGVLAATVYWRNIIRNVLPPESNGITIVIENACTKSFTYQINGPDVVFIGVDDKHEVKFHNLKVSRKITDLEKLSFTASVYSGAPISEDYCPYTINIYPTDQMQSEFTTNNAAIFAAVTILVAIGLGIVFFMYDFKVEHRQKKVLDSAMRSSEIVSSLFPSSVRDQLYPDAENEEKRKTMMWHMQPKPDRLETIPMVDGPIAKLYPETTVMFADIKGFTQWSASREPTHVFHLLETLYGGFDALTRLYGVFKVETIGDTYVAVVGLPNPRKNHAVVMARFAKKCLEKMTELTSELESTLGLGTAELSLRVGLNSGPTTAGVLRGEKARFQLFGDTVNTASRMESNGESNRIHISESTAKLIEKDGKRHWLTPRDTQITVKGKGTMQTYWCEITNNHSSVNGESTIPSCDNELDDARFHSEMLDV